MKQRNLICVLGILVMLIGSVSEARVGGGRSFGNRGSRGFTAPRSYGSGSSPYHSYGTQSAPSQMPQQPRDYSQSQSTFRKPSLLGTFGAGLAGGLLGGMLSRSLGYASPGFGGGGSGGIGLLEILLIGGLLYFLYRFLSRRSATTPTSDSYATYSRPEESRSSSNLSNFGSGPSTGTGAESLMNKVRYFKEPQAPALPIDPEHAMDLFFQIQGAWKNRDLSPVQNILDSDAKEHLEREVSRLKTSKQVNYLENIAVREKELMETWEEMGKKYSTIRFSANLLDYTLQEDTQQLVEGSKTTPVKFEEYWTFSKDTGSSSWKLSAIQQM
jgi:predicted lipid-binding transport protein (Tim44 family)